MASAFEEHSVAAWPVGLEEFKGKRVSPTTKDMINGRGGTVTKVEACLSEPANAALMLSNAWEATFSSQGNEKLRLALDITTAGLGMLLNVIEKSMSYKDIGRLETDI
jgi:hypothetical protein